MQFKIAVLRGPVGGTLPSRNFGGCDKSRREDHCLKHSATRFMHQVFRKRPFGPVRCALGMALLLSLVCIHSNGDFPRGDTLREGKGAREGGKPSSKRGATPCPCMQ